MIIYKPEEITFDNDGNMYIVDTDDHKIRKVDTNGIITTVIVNKLKNAVNNIHETKDELIYPISIAFDKQGNICFVDIGNHKIRKIDKNTNIVSTIVGTGVKGYNGDNIPATLAQLAYPRSIAIDGQNNIYISDSGNKRIRKVDNKGIITTLVGDGILDNIKATDSYLNSPQNITFDNIGNMYISDSGNDIIRKVDKDGVITNFIDTLFKNTNINLIKDDLAKLKKPRESIFDSFGNLYIADAGNNRIIKRDVNGITSIFAGTGKAGYSGDNGQATNAQLMYPTNLVFDKENNLYIADTYNNRIRKVSSNGIITTIVGGGTSLGDGGQATNANLDKPIKIIFDNQGNLYIADTDNNRIRKVSPNGIISTFAGNGYYGYNGDNILANSSSLKKPMGISFDINGNMYIADSGNNRIRKVDKNGIITTIVGSEKYDY